MRSNHDDELLAEMIAQINNGCEEVRDRSVIFAEELHACAVELAATKRMVPCPMCGRTTSHSHPDHLDHDPIDQIRTVPDTETE